MFFYQTFCVPRSFFGQHHNRKGNLKRETEFFLIAAENNAIRTNYVKKKINKAQQNSKFRLCDDKREMINYIISECWKFGQ